MKPRDAAEAPIAGEEGRERVRLAEVLDRRRDDVIARWSRRVRDDLGVELELSELLDAMPDYLRGLAEMMRKQRRPSSYQDGGAALWSDVAREHAITRVRQGFDIASLFREFTSLRTVLVEVVHEEGFRDGAIVEALTESIEAAVQRAVESYVESRDSEARRTEAEHVAFVTHELRNPLATATLGVSRLRELIAGAPEVDRALELVLRAHSKMEELIDSVLTVEKVRTAELELHPVPVPIRDIVEDAITGAREQAEAKHIPLEVRYDPELVLRTDRRLTASAIQNLVDNAVKYGGAGPVEVWTESTEEHVLFHVRDRCGGLSQGELDTIFLPFRRGRRQQAASGTGLGLSITKRAVEAQGGSVHVESTGEGCHFWITLPRAAESSLRKPPESARV